MVPILNFVETVTNFDSYDFTIVPLTLMRICPLLTIGYFCTEFHMLVLSLGGPKLGHWEPVSNTLFIYYLLLRLLGLIIRMRFHFRTETDR